MKREIPSIKKLVTEQLNKRITAREKYRKKVLEKTGKPVKKYKQREK